MAKKKKTTKKRKARRSHEEMVAHYNATHCQRPDRHAAELGLTGTQCGYPLPCPHHTIIMDTTGDEVRISHNMPLDEKTQRRLFNIGKAVQDDATPGGE